MQSVFWVALRCSDITSALSTYYAISIFAVVRAVVARSFAGKQTIGEVEAAVLGRLHSLAQTHALLGDKETHSADLADVIRNEMSPCADRTAIDGPRLRLAAKAAQNFALAVHELATNAAKYGALSNASGHIRITWRVDEPARTLSFRWEEHGGPPVEPPTRKGFGRVVLEQVIGEYCEDEPIVDFAPHGLTYTMICSLTELVPASS